MRRARTSRSRWCSTRCRAATTRSSRPASGRKRSWFIRPRTGARASNWAVGNLTLLLDAPSLGLQLLADGVLVGAIFALVAYGMALVWGVMNIINIAQGEFVMLGGYVVFYLDRAGVHPVFGIPIAAAAMYVLGIGLYRTVIWRIVDRDMFTAILATFGISILLQQLANQLFSADIR